MKKIIITLVFLTAGVFMANILFGILTPYNLVTAYFDKKKGNLKIIDTLQTPAFNEKQIIAKSLGFQYVKATSSNISTSKMNGIKMYDKSMMQELTKQLGKTWTKTWDRRTDSLFRINTYEKMKAAVLEIPEVIEYGHFLDSISNGKEKPFVIVFVDAVEGNAHVGRLNKNNSVSVFYNYTIDPYTLKSEKIQY